MATELDAAALWDVYVQALSRLPDSELIATPRWMQLRTPSSKHSNLNKVVMARLEPHEADAKIAEVMAEHQARGAGLGWAVSPDSAPEDLSARLEAAGLPRRGVMVGMVREVPRASDDAALIARPIDGLEIVLARVEDATSYAAFSTEAWGRGEAFRRAMEESARRYLADPEGVTRLYLARIDGELVGTCQLRLLRDGVGYLQGAVVSPTHRGRGLYRALTAIRLAELRRGGYEHVVIWSNELSTPLAERLGFRELARGAYHDTA